MEVSEVLAQEEQTSSHEFRILDPSFQVVEDEPHYDVKKRSSDSIVIPLMHENLLDFGICFLSS